ncbi:acyl carrier protein [Pleionea sediminis]|uniref:acyl carrier protein n=1 Tax=Pleionea sediminis TaxID=2569479 RepID=UPI001184A1A8|nr:acyl carrier protein [Pleionea sediminis]
MSNASISETTKQLLIDTLSLSMSAEELSEDTPLLGNFPEFDSMAIVAVVTQLEETFEFTAEDDELSAEVFETVGSLITFVENHTN